MAGELAQLQTTAVVMVPVLASSVPANALFSDSGSAGAFTNKSPGGSTVIVVSASNDIFLKIKQNLSGVTIPSGMPAALLPDGSIARADSDTPANALFLGIAQEEIVDQASGKILTIGPNVAGAITGMGFAPGDPIFLSEDRTYTNSLATFTGNNDKIMQVGFADCSPGNASSTATDLIVVYSLVSDAP